MLEECRKGLLLLSFNPPSLPLLIFMLFSVFHNMQQLGKGEVFILKGIAKSQDNSLIPAPKFLQSTCQVNMADEYSWRNARKLGAPD